MLNQLLQFTYHFPYFLFCIVAAERKADGDHIGVVVHRADDMAAFGGAAGAGTAAGNTNALYIEVEEQHF